MKAWVCDWCGRVIPEAEGEPEETLFQIAVYYETERRPDSPMEGRDLPCSWELCVKCTAAAVQALEGVRVQILLQEVPKHPDPAEPAKEVKPEQQEAERPPVPAEVQDPPRPTRKPRTRKIGLGRHGQPIKPKPCPKCGAEIDPRGLKRHMAYCSGPEASDQKRPERPAKAKSAEPESPAKDQPFKCGCGIGFPTARELSTHQTMQHFGQRSLSGSSLA